MVGLDYTAHVLLPFKYQQVTMTGGAQLFSLQQQNILTKQQQKTRQYK